MKDQVPEAMPACFENWCRRFDDLFSRQKQRQGFRSYLGGLLGESQRKNLAQIASNTVDESYNHLRHFLNESPWDTEKLNDRRLEVMRQCRQTTPSRDFTLIVDDSGHRKSGDETAGVGRQYIGEIGKTDNGIVLLSTHLYDGVRRLPLDVALYQHASSLAQGKEDPEFVKKPDLALKLIDQCLERKYRPHVIVVDAGYGNNTPFIKQLESRKLQYIAAIAKNRQVTYQLPGEEQPCRHSLTEIAQVLDSEHFTPVSLTLDQPRTVWVATLQVQVPKLEGTRWIAIQLNAATWQAATDVDYFLTNASDAQVSAEWMARTYSQRNWVEVFYREAKGWFGLSQYQVRDLKSMKRHWILVFTAYTFVLWHQLTGGVRRRWATKPLQTIAETLAAFRTDAGLPSLCKRLPKPWQRFGPPSSSAWCAGSLLMWMYLPLTELSRATFGHRNFQSPTKIAQLSLAERFLVFPAEIFEQVFKDLLPQLQHNWQQRLRRPVPDSIKFAQTDFEQIWVADGTTEDVLNSVSSKA